MAILKAFVSMTRTSSATGKRGMALTGDVRKLSRYYRGIWRGLRWAMYPIAFLSLGVVFGLSWQTFDTSFWKDASTREAFGPLGTDWLISVFAIASIVACCFIGTFRFTLAGLSAAAVSITAFIVHTYPRIFVDVYDELARLAREPKIEIETLMGAQWLVMYLCVALGLCIAARHAVGLLRSSMNSRWPARDFFKGFTRDTKLRRQTYRLYNISRLWVTAPVLIGIWFIGYVMVKLFEYLGPWMLKGAPPSVYSNFEEFKSFAASHPLRIYTTTAAPIAIYIGSLLACVLCLRLGWHFIRRRAADVLSDTGYRPIVFLRSFQDERARVSSSHFFRWLTWRRTNLEEVIVRTLAPLGPAVAVGKPGDRMPRLGALRAYYSDDHWQDAVREWLRRADLVVVLGGASPWSLWEFGYVLASGAWDRLVLIIPPDKTQADRQARWLALCEAAINSPWRDSLRNVASADILCLALGEGGKITHMTGNCRYQVDYEIATQCITSQVLRLGLAMPRNDDFARGPLAERQKRSESGVPSSRSNSPQNS
jgi:hypothetical protein